MNVIERLFDHSEITVIHNILKSKTVWWCSCIAIVLLLFFFFLLKTFKRLRTWQLMSRQFLPESLKLSHREKDPRPNISYTSNGRSRAILLIHVMTCFLRWWISDHPKPEIAKEAKFLYKLRRNEFFQPCRRVKLFPLFIWVSSWVLCQFCCFIGSSEPACSHQRF